MSYAPRNRIKNFGTGIPYNEDAADIQSRRIQQNKCPKCNCKMIQSTTLMCSNAMCGLEIKKGDVWNKELGFMRAAKV